MHCINCENTIKYALMSDKDIKRVCYYFSFDNSHKFSSL